MSGKEKRAEARREKRKAEKNAYLNREGKKNAGMDLPNAGMQYDDRIPETVKAELGERQEIVEAQFKAYRSILPGLLKKLGRIDDVRSPKKVKHKHTVVLLYGILMFAFNMTSRKEANREMNKAIFFKNIKMVFPEIKELPHADTLERILEKIDINKIEETLTETIRQMIREKRFKNFLYKKGYAIAIDGTQKHIRDYRVAEEWLKRKVNGKEGTKEERFYVYVLEAILVFPNGIRLPFMSEFLDFEEYQTAQGKQDSEPKAFRRLSARIKKAFPRLAITLLLDGLYPTGPVFEICKKYNWGYMMVLQDGNLKTVWHEVKHLKEYEDNDKFKKDEKRRIHKMNWANRNQEFWWVNDIDYDYMIDGKKKHSILHVVVCEETWDEYSSKEKKMLQKSSKHAWVSSEPISKQNIHERCNLLGRFRWKIETNILIEKKYGYSYEHCFSHDWNAMRGFHYLMHIGHFLNEIAFNTVELAEKVKKDGITVFMKNLKLAYGGWLLDEDRFKYMKTKKFQLRLVWW